MHTGKDVTATTTPSSTSTQPEAHTETDFTVETPLKTRVDRGILDFIAPTAPSTGFAHSGAPLTGPPLTGPPVTGDRDDGEALPPGFKELIAWTRGDGGSVSILGHDDKDDAPDISPI
jgi:hypothetical protein